MNDECLISYFVEDYKQIPELSVVLFRCATDLMIVGIAGGSLTPRRRRTDDFINTQTFLSSKPRPAIFKAVSQTVRRHESQRSEPKAFRPNGTDFRFCAVVSSSRSKFSRPEVATTSQLIERSSQLRSRTGNSLGDRRKPVVSGRIEPLGLILPSWGIVA